jgi:hypothetical protein
MRTTKNFHVQRSNAVGIGPELTFAAAIFVGVAVWAGLSITLPPDLVVPIIATLSFGFAAALAVVASLRGFENSACVTYADVAGAITLIGVCIAATIEPEQMVGIIAGDQHGRDP